MDNKEVIYNLYRLPLSNRLYSFSEVVDEVISIFGNTKEKSNMITDNKLNAIWNFYKREARKDEQSGITPLLEIIDESTKEVRWSAYNPKYTVRQRVWLQKRPHIFSMIKNFSHREFEALGYAVCKIIGANNIMLTEAGNEGGIDFIATIKFSDDAHHIFGCKGPIRLIGQCKKYSSSVQVGALKEFCQTLQHVYNLSYRPGEILPDWFKSGKGSIIGWHIASSDHQSGAKDLAKNHGILLSNERELTEVIAKSKLIRQNPKYLEDIQEMVRNVLSSNIVNNLSS